MDVREPKCKRCEYSSVYNAAKNYYCKCEVCEQYVKDHEDLFKVTNEIISKFGNDALWLALVLIQLIDKEKWSFDNEFQLGQLTDVMKFIEENETLRGLFAKKN